MPEQDFFKSFQPAVSVFEKHIERGSLIRLVTHNDADGLSSGAIMTLIALRKKARFKISSEKKLDEKLLLRVKEEHPDLVVFSDFGSGYLDLIAENLSQDVIVLDHHLSMEHKSENIVHINPMLHEIDGAREIAASGVCYFLAKALDPENIDLACLGLLGALGDQQDKVIEILKTIKKYNGKEEMEEVVSKAGGKELLYHAVSDKKKQKELDKLFS